MPEHYTLWDEEWVTIRTSGSIKHMPLKAWEKEQMSKAYPRRRDVRDRLLAIYEVLHANFDPADADFDRDYLTEVRDLLREGADLEPSILLAGQDEPEIEMTEEEFAVFIDQLREAAMAAAGVPEESEWDPEGEDPEEGSDYNYDY